MIKYKKHVKAKYDKEKLYRYYKKR